jgi:hypothetical protein
MGDKNFSVSNVLGKPPGEPKLEEIYSIGKQLGKGAFGVVRLATRKTNWLHSFFSLITKGKITK